MENAGEDDETGVWAAQYDRRHDPCSEECQAMRTYRNRVASFAEKKWKSALMKSATCGPAKMAVMWYCCGPDSARCFACFKELEGWEAQDDPHREHSKHCPNCPLLKCDVFRKGFGTLTLREQLRLDVAIEFARKRVMAEANWKAALQPYADMRDQLDKLIRHPPAYDIYEFRDENCNPWQDEL